MTTRTHLATRKHSIMACLICGIALIAPDPHEPPATPTHQPATIMMEQSASISASLSRNVILPTIAN